VIAYYFSSTFIKGGPTNGTKPLPRAKPERREILHPLEMTKEIEEILNGLNFEESDGDFVIYRNN